MQFSIRLVGLLPILVCLTLAQDRSDTYSNPTFGLSITKPTGWHWMTAEQNQENLSKTKLDDEEFQRLITKYASAPMVAITKFEEPYENVNPSVKINVRSIAQLPEKDPVRILKMIMPRFEKVFNEFEINYGPVDTLVSDYGAAYARFYYNMILADSTTFPTCSELWIVPKGDFMFMIGAGTRQDEQTGKREEIAEIIKSIVIVR